MKLSLLKTSLVFALVTSHALAWTWIAPTASTGGNTIFGAAYSPELDMVIAVNMGGSVLRKTGDGPWRTDRVPGPVGLGSAHWTGRHFIISGMDADGQWHAVSADGEKWTPIAKLRSERVNSFASSSDATVALDDDYSAVLVSSDPARAVWRKIDLPRSFEWIAQGNNTFVLCDWDGVTAYSANGTTWSTSPDSSPVTGSSVSFLTFSAGLFVIVADNGSRIFTSNDGREWRARDLPAGLEVGRIVPTPSKSLILGYDREGEKSVGYTTSDFAEWTAFELDDFNRHIEWVMPAAAPDKDGGAYLFGSGGRIERFSPAGNLQTEIDPGGPVDPCDGFSHLAGFPAMLFGAFKENSLFESEASTQAYSLGSAGRWVELTEGLDHASRPLPQSFHQLSDGVLAVAEGRDRVLALYEYKDGAWSLLGPAPQIGEGWSIISVTRSSQGRMAALCRGDRREDLPSYRDYKIYFSDNAQQWQDSGFAWQGIALGEAENVVRHDGKRFLAVLDPGRIFMSQDGASWTLLPSPPDDTPGFRKSYYGGNSSVPLSNEPRSFASNGDVLIAGSDKLSYSVEPAGYLGVAGYNALDQLFAYSFASGTWKSVVPPGARRRAGRAPAVRWNGSIFLAAVRDGSCLSADYEGGYIYTSPNGYDWTKREFPVGGNLLDVLWTGTEFAAVTRGNSVVTHPTGLSQPIAASGPPAQADKITFTKIPPKVFGAPPFALKANAKSRRPVAFSSSNTDVASVEGAVATVKAAGTISITATVAGDTSVASVQQPLVVKPLQQKFSIQAKQVQRINVPFDLAVKGNSSLPLEFTSEPVGVITVQAVDGGYTATASATGKLKLTATQPGDSNRLAAKQVTKIFTIE